MKSDHFSIMGDFNCTEVSWEDWTTNSGEKSLEEHLTKTMKNVMTHWINESVRYRGGKASLKLDLIFTKELDIIDDIEFESPMRKCGQVLIEF